MLNQLYYTMGSKTLQLCFSIYAAADENLFIPEEEFSYASCSAVVNDIFLRSDTSTASNHQCLYNHIFVILSLCHLVCFRRELLDHVKRHKLSRNLLHGVTSRF